MERTSTVTVMLTMSDAEAELLDDVLTIVHDYVYSGKRAANQEQLISDIERLQSGRGTSLAGLVNGIVTNARARIAARRK